jgi:ssDNA-binding Zn-finger/Zn-ribbon topoisomerase 1
MAPGIKVECPKCHSSDVTKRMAVEDKRAAFLEIDVTCPKCSRIWRMFFDRGRAADTSAYQF